MQHSWQPHLNRHANWKTCQSGTWPTCGGFTGLCYWGQFGEARQVSTQASTPVFVKASGWIDAKLVSDLIQMSECVHLGEWDGDTWVHTNAEEFTAIMWVNEQYAISECRQKDGCWRVSKCKCMWMTQDMQMKSSSRGNKYKQVSDTIRASTW